MKRLHRFLLLTTIAVAGFTCSTATDWNHPTEPISGARFEALVAAQNVPLQRILESHFPDSEGYLVTGPLTLYPSGGDWDSALIGIRDVDDWFVCNRVVCPNLGELESADSILERIAEIDIIEKTRYIHDSRSGFPAGYRGITVTAGWKETEYKIQFNTVQQTRWLIWLRQLIPDLRDEAERDRLNAYSVAVSDYLYAVDRRVRSPEVDEPYRFGIYFRDFERAIENAFEDPEAPIPGQYGLDERFDFYRAPPDYVIQGYDNYLDFLRSHAAIHTDFANGILSFIPTDSLLEAIKAGAPSAAHPNKELPMLQHEYRKYFSRGGDVRFIKTLTWESLMHLPPGDYFFAVGLSGKIRFGRELSHQEAGEIHYRAQKPPPRANHAFLFPGEPVLAAGTFGVEKNEAGSYIARVTAQSGHYFYSNINASIYEDITEKSDWCLLTVGHFFRALDAGGIPYFKVLISKF
jgi:hypothetical protein